MLRSDQSAIRLSVIRETPTRVSPPPAQELFEFRALRGADREALSNEMMFPDSTRRKLHDSLDRASGLRNRGELSNAQFNAGLLTYRFAAFDHLTMPVLVIVGGQDRAVGGPPMRELAKRVPHGRSGAVSRAKIRAL